MPTSPRSLLLGVALAFALTALAPLAAASPITYTYTGNPYTTLSNFSCNGTGICGIEGSLTLAAPLAANQSYSNVTALSYSFTDGQDTFTQFNSTVFDFLFVTDAGGNIYGWNTGLQNNADNSYFYADAVSGDEAYDQGTTSGSASNSAPGTWTVGQAQVTPEPSSWALLGTGVLALLGLTTIDKRRRNVRVPAA